MKIKEIRYISTVTGPGVTDKWDVVGTDLGIPIYDPSNKKMYFLFGDTEGESEIDKTKTRNWRGTIAGYTTSLDFSDGIKWDGFISDENGNARELVIAHHSSTPIKENTKISQGGIVIDENLYIFYESIRGWGPRASGYWYLNFGGVIKSSDGGQSFEKVYDLTWIEPTKDAELENAVKVIKEDMMLNPINFDFDAEAHIAPGFGQMYACDGKDGYIYVFGRHGGRIHGIKVGRVLKEKFEVFSEYEYLTEYDKDGKAVWLPYRLGLDAIAKYPEKAEIIPAPTSNMSVAYNEYLKKWMLVYYYPNKGICFATAEHPYGPYTDITLALPIDHPELIKDIQLGVNGNSLYGGFTHERINRENGKIVSLVISQWYDRPNTNRFYGSKLFEIELD